MLVRSDSEQDGLTLIQLNGLVSIETTLSDIGTNIPPTRQDPPEGASICWTCVSTLHTNLVKGYEEQPSVRVVLFK